jgi:hypothetical protein
VAGGSAAQGGIIIVYTAPNDAAGKMIMLFM